MSYSVSRVPWEQAELLLRTVRERVFVCEWRIPKRIEFDQLDKTAFHMLVCDDDSQEPIATGRILPNGEIGRIAVISEHRDRNLDKIVIQGLLRIAKDLALEEVYIASPLDSVKHFIEHKFYSVGSVFMEAGLPKQKMACAVHSMPNVKYYLSH